MNLTKEELNYLEEQLNDELKRLGRISNHASNQEYKMKAELLIKLLDYRNHLLREATKFLKEIK